MPEMLELIHPGEILEEEFLRPLGLSANELAKRIDVPATRISEIIRGRRGITADTALRLARFFGTSADLWLGLQSEHDLRAARRELGRSLESRIQPMKVESRYAHDPQAPSYVREAGPGVPRARDRRRARRKI
jgi:addiction module HigA family antidote